MDPKEETSNDGEAQEKKGFLRLRSANHNEDTCNSIAEDYRAGKFTDFVLICGDDASQVMQAHRLILSKASDYFKKVIEAASNVSFGYPIIPMIALKEVPYNDLKAIIDFIYEGKITIPKKQLDSVVKTAQFLQVNGLQHLNNEKARTGSQNKTSEQNVSQDLSASQETKPNVYVPKIDPSLVSKLDNRDSTQITLSTPNVVISRSQAATPTTSAVVSEIRTSSTASTTTSSANVKEKSLSLILNPSIRPKPPNTADTLTQHHATIHFNPHWKNTHPQLFNILKSTINKQRSIAQKGQVPSSRIFPSLLKNNSQTLKQPMPTTGPLPLVISTTIPNVVYPQYVQVVNTPHSNVSLDNLQSVETSNSVAQQLKIVTTSASTPTSTNAVSLVKSSVNPTNESQAFSALKGENSTNEQISKLSSVTEQKSVEKSSQSLLIQNGTEKTVSDQSKSDQPKPDKQINPEKGNNSQHDEEKAVSNVESDCQKENSPESDEKLHISENNGLDISPDSLNSVRFADDELPGVIFGPSKSKNDETLKSERPSNVTPTLIRPLKRVRESAKKGRVLHVSTRESSDTLVKESPSKRKKSENKSVTEISSVVAFRESDFEVPERVPLRKTSPNKNSKATTSAGESSSVNDDFKTPEVIWLDL